MDGVEIIAPPQYSIAWSILALLCVIVSIALIITALKVSRWFVERSAYAKRPQEKDVLKAEFLRSVNEIGSSVDAGEMDAREGHRELENVLRIFLLRSDGLDVRTTSLQDLVLDPRTATVGRLIARIHEPGYARESSTSLSASLAKARTVIRSWS